ncbi:MAG TPA: ATP-dependent DNA helicase RecG, partial [Acidobacteria bacterium]|nr:ATP-dependent DNA helicase RecG [Acidobacteriota bacterium]
RTVGDLLMWVPSRWEDRSRAVSPAAVGEPGRPVLVRGRIGALKLGRPRGRGRRVVTAVVRDGEGTLPGVWFNQAWIARELKGAPEVVLYGRVERRSRTGQLQLVNPEVSPVESAEPGIVAVYRRTGPLGGRRLRRLMDQALETLPDLEDPVPREILDALGLPGLREALTALHRPPLPASEAERAALLADLEAGRTPAQRRLAFDELLAVALAVESVGQRRRRQRAAVRAGPPRGRLELVFEPTAAQRRVIAEILADLAGPAPMARLLQGDVGSGKTVVAAHAALAVLEAGGTVALMAPTELLAEQHRASLERLFAGTGIEPLLLTGSVGAAERRRILGLLASGPRLVVGTHALVQDSVRLERLGLVVVDEQHRFGVAHRMALAAKGRAPHLLVMTATPIPRSLALVAYGDLELSVLDELPPGRRPVRTVVRRRDQADRLWRFVRQEVAAGGRAYVVYPLIEESEELEAQSLAENEERLRRLLPGVSVGVLHGRMGRREREEAVADFRSGRTGVLLSTTVVEVGVDVPEASVMVIESPERFGLSQLHQLRGRVGRGPRQAWCVLLVPDVLPGAARRRLEVFCSTGDGFELAEADLELRGPGEIAGFRQWGADGLRFARLSRDRDLLERARGAAARLGEMGKLDQVLERLAPHLGGGEVPGGG